MCSDGLRFCCSEKKSMKSKMYLYFVWTFAYLGHNFNKHVRLSSLKACYKFLVSHHIYSNADLDSKNARHNQLVHAIEPVAFRSAGLLSIPFRLQLWLTVAAEIKSFR